MRRSRLGVAAFGSDKAVKEVAGGRARAARSALFRMDLGAFPLCMEWGRDVSCALPFPTSLERQAKKVSCSQLFTEKARMGARRVQARLCGRDARALPWKPNMNFRDLLICAR